MPESEVEKAVVSIEEHARLRRDLADAGEQFTATSEVLAALGRHASDPDAVLGTIVESARRLCRAQAAQIYLLDGDVYRLSRRSRTDGRDTATTSASTPSTRTADVSVGRVGLDRRTQQITDVLADPDYGRAGPAADRRLPDAHVLTDAAGRRGRRGALGVAHQVDAVRRPRGRAARRLRGAGGHRRSQCRPRAGARGPQRRAGAQGGCSWRLSATSARP